MTRCVQCGGEAAMHIAWLAKASTSQDIPQDCAICMGCMSALWAKHAHTQFGQTVTMRPIQ